MTPTDLTRAIADSLGLYPMEDAKTGYWHLQYPDGRKLGFHQGLDAEHARKCFTPAYLTDANASLELIAELNADGLWVTCRFLPSGRVEVHAHDGTLKLNFEIVAPSFPQAVAEAYAKAKGIWTD